MGDLPAIAFISNNRTFNEAILRAGDIWVHFFRGSSIAAIIGEIITLLLVQLLRRRYFSTNRQWGLSVKDGWKLIGLDTVIATVVVGLITFIASLFMAWYEEPTFTAQQIDEYGKGIVVQVMDGTSPPHAGFWVSTNGLLITSCPDMPETNATAVIVVPVPQMTTGPMISPAQFTASSSVLQVNDAQTSACLFFAEHSPFQRDLHFVSMVHFVNSNRTISTKELFWVPKLLNGSVHGGENLYLVYVESKGQELATGTIESKVTRMGVDMKAKKRFLRIHISTPFKSEFLGSPVLNSSEMVVGVVAGGDSSEMVLIPTEYILELRPFYNKGLHIWE